MATARSQDTGSWTFITNHAQVLLYVSAHPGALVREIADAVGITERRTYGILRDLDDGGYVDRKRVGREVHFKVRPGKHLRAPLVSNAQVRDLLALLENDR
jgi:DNA-binding MarR family transcriptional regulator